MKKKKKQKEKEKETILWYFCSRHVGFFLVVFLFSWFLDFKRNIYPMCQHSIRITQLTLQQMVYNLVSIQYTYNLVFFLAVCVKQTLVLGDDDECAIMVSDENSCFANLKCVVVFFIWAFIFYFLFSLFLYFILFFLFLPAVDEKKRNRERERKKEKSVVQLSRSPFTMKMI